MALCNDWRHVKWLRNVLTSTDRNGIWMDGRESYQNNRR